MAHITDTIFTTFTDDKKSPITKPYHKIVSIENIYTEKR